MGGATLYLKDERFIKLKPTAVYGILALFMATSQFIGKKTLVQRLLETNINLPNKVWRQLNCGWVIFFSAMGVVNLWVAYQFSTNVWVNFKLFGTLGLTILFVIIQGAFLAPYIEDKKV